MGLIARGATELRATLANPPDWMWRAFAGTTALSGVRVSPDSALTLSAFYRGVRLLADSIASLPLITYRRLRPRGKLRDRDFVTHDVLHSRWNPEMTSFEARQFVMGCVLLRGNGFAVKETASSGRVDTLWPLPAHQVEVKRSEGGALEYVWHAPSGEPVPFRREEILHVRAFSRNGVTGESVIEHARNSLGLALAEQEYGAKFYAQGAHPGGVLHTDKGLSDKAFARLKEQFKGGLTSAHKTAILEEGLKWEAVGLNHDDAQWLQSRKHSVTEVARWLGLQPHKLADLERATFSNIEEQGREFVTDSLLPWLVNFEQAYWRDLLTERDQRAGYFYEHKVDGLLRGKFQDRMLGYSTAIQWGMMSPNETRDLENLNPREGGDVYLLPLNMVVQGSEGDPNVRARVVPIEEARAKMQARRSAESRRRMARQLEPVYEDAARRLLRGERKQVLAQARKQLDRRDRDSFLAWLEDFYGAEYEQVVSRQIGPAVSTLAGMVSAEAFDEIDASDDVRGAFGLDALVATMVTALAKTWARRSSRTLRTDLLENPDDEIGALERRFDDWDQKRPGKTAKRHTVQGVGYVARQVWTSAGVTRFRWVAFGTSCPACTSLDGQIVSAQDAFLPAGQEIDAGEGQAPIRHGRDTLHPPLHGGCDCQIVPA